MEKQFEDHEVADSEAINALEVDEPEPEEKEMPGFPEAQSNPYPVNRDAVDEVL